MILKLLGEGIRAWWRRRTRGFVAAPKLHGGRGTSWQEHKRHEIGFTCACGEVLAFMSTDLVIREREHVAGCIYPNDLVRGEYCDCPIIDARYVKICPGCRLGHWKDGTRNPSIAGTNA